MLTAVELKAIEDNFNVICEVARVGKIPGGDVNETYILYDRDSKYFVKKIDVNCLARSQRISTEMLEYSVEFNEDLVAQISVALPAVAAFQTKSGNRFFKQNSSGLLIYPFVEGQERSHDQITDAMVGLIATHLYVLHNLPLCFDKSVAESKLMEYKKIGLSVLSSPLWGAVSALPFIKYVVPNFYEVINYISSNKSDLKRAIEEIVGDGICHNDLKPKNVLWASSQSPWVVDWDAAGLFDIGADHLDTALAWSMHYNNEAIHFSSEKFKIFVENYPFPSVKRLNHCLRVVIIKWCYWLIFCIKKMALLQGSARRNLWNVRYSLEVLRILGQPGFEKQLAGLPDTAR